MTWQNFAGVLTGKAFQAVLHTLHEAFAQCRTFRDALGAAKDQEGSDLSNLVIFCTVRNDVLIDNSSVIADHDGHTDGSFASVDIPAGARGGQVAIPAKVTC